MSDIFGNYFIEQEEVEAEKNTSKIKDIINKIIAFLGKIGDSIKDLFKSNMNEDEILKKQSEIRLEYDIENAKKDADNKISEGHKLIKMLASKTGIEPRVIDEYCQKCSDFLSSHKKEVIIGSTAGFLFVKHEVPKFIDKAKSLFSKSNVDSGKSKEQLKILNAMKKVSTDISNLGLKLGNKIKGGKSASMKESVEYADLFEESLRLDYDIHDAIYESYDVNFKSVESNITNMEILEESLNITDNNFSSLLAKVVLEAESVEDEYNLDKEIIALKLLKESGTVEDEITMLTEASTEAFKKMKDSIIKMIETFITWFKESLSTIKAYYKTSKVADKVESIKDLLSKHGDKAKEKVEVIDIDYVDKTSKSIKSKIDIALAKTKSGKEVSQSELDEIENGIEELKSRSKVKIAVSAGAVATAVGLIVTKKIVEKRYEEASKELQKIGTDCCLGKKDSEEYVDSYIKVCKDLTRNKGILDKLTLSTYTNYLKNALSSLQFVCKGLVGGDK